MREAEVLSALSQHLGVSQAGKMQAQAGEGMTALVFLALSVLQGVQRLGNGTWKHPGADGLLWGFLSYFL